MDLKKHFRQLVMLLLTVSSIYAANTQVFAATSPARGTPPTPTLSAALPVSASVTPQAIQSGSLVYEKQFLAFTLQAGNPYSMVNGKKTKLDAVPAVSGQQLVAPLKFLAQTLGAVYEYNTKTKTAVITRGQIKISMTAGSKVAILNGKKTPIPVALAVKPTVTAPVSFIADALGAGYAWDIKTKTATLTLRDKYIAFPDKELEKAVRQSLRQPTGDLLLSSMKKISTLFYLNTHLSDTSLANLDGMQYLTELQSLYILNSNVSDIGSLRSLKKLTTLTITGSKIADLSPIAGLNGLLQLDLSNNRIADVSPLKNMKNLLSLTLSDNFIGDASPLLSLPAVTRIILWDTKNREELAAINRVAAEIVSKAAQPEMTDYEKELALHDYLLAVTRYDRENFEKDTVPEESHHAFAVFTKGVGVCDGYAEAMQILLSRAGIESRVVLGDSTGPDGGGHAWNIVKIDGDYYQLDPTYDDPLTQDNSDYMRHLYFNLSDSQMGITHKWDRTLYPACTKDNPQFTAELLRRKDQQFNGTISYMIDEYRLCRINADGSFTQLCEDKASDLNLVGGWLYYINIGDSGKIYKIRTDGSERTKVSDYAANMLVVKDNWIYLAGESSLYRMDLTGGNVHVVATNDVISSFILDGEWIYYKGFNADFGTRLYKVKPDGSSLSVIFNDKPAGFELINGGTSVRYTNDIQEIYYDGSIYFVNESDSNSLYRAKTDGSSVIKLASDRITELNIEITGNWVYYRNAGDGNKYYRVRIDGTEQQRVRGQS